ncbi:single-stranded DNA-binding protein, partial [Bifidobacterium parmae]
MGIQQALVTVTGNLGADPVPFTTGAGVPACSFRLGVTPRFYDQNAGQWRDRGTSWVGVCAYRSLAKNILGSLSKGDPAIVSGTLRVERWQKDGADRSSPVIDASAVGPDLSQGIARISKLNRGQPGADAPANGGGAGGVNVAGGAGVPGAGGMAPPANGGVPANGVADPMNPAIPPNRAGMGTAVGGAVAGVTIDTSGVGGDGGGTAGGAAGATG